jgi:hypothetical protein
MVLAHVLTKCLAIAMPLAAIMMPLAQVVAQLAEVLLEIRFILRGIGRIGFHVLEVLANLRQVMTNVMAIPVQVLTIVIHGFVIVPNVALVVFASGAWQGEDLHVVELPVQLALIVPNLVALFGNVLEVVQDGLLVRRRVAWIGLPIGQVLANVSLVRADLVAVALDALQVSGGRRSVVTKIGRSTARRPTARAARRRVTSR